MKQITKIKNVNTMVRNKLAGLAISNDNVCDYATIALNLKTNFDKILEVYENYITNHLEMYTSLSQIKHAPDLIAIIGNKLQLINCDSTGEIRHFEQIEINLVEKITDKNEAINILNEVRNEILNVLGKTAKEYSLPTEFCENATRVSYADFKNLYSKNKTVANSYDAATKTILVFIS